jgi:D-glycero-alpha-D-manno-heptose-7-phosphate kinase
MVVRGRAPYRISLGGGGTDLPTYSEVHGGATLVSTIDQWVHGTLVPRDDATARVYSADYDVTAEYRLDQPIADQNSHLRLLTAILDRLAPARGFDLYLESDAPVGTGLGASGALSALVVALVDNYLGLHSSKHHLAETAFEISRSIQGIKVGRQDEYSAAFGGFNFMEFGTGPATVVPLRLEPWIAGEFEYHALLCYTRKQRLPDFAVNEHIETFQQGRPETVVALARLKELAYECRDNLLRGDIPAVAANLHEGGLMKQQMNPHAIPATIVELYESSRAAGVLGGKLLGSGGGGYLLLLCDFGRKAEAIAALEAGGGAPVPVHLVDHGVLTWRIPKSNLPQSAWSGRLG